MMSLATMAVIVAALTALIFLGMWLGWRSRQRRGERIPTSTEPVGGEVIAEFPRAGYVSTTPVGEPFTRIAIPGLTYKGNATVTVRTGGVSIQVTGEHAVHLHAAQILGQHTARARVGKAVERDGLHLLAWATDETDVESAFRFSSYAEQQRFALAIDALTQTSSVTRADGPDSMTDTLQEDA